MNQNLDQLFCATSIDQLKEAIALNPNVNEIHPRYGQIAIQYHLNLHKMILDYIPYIPRDKEIPSHDTLYEMVKLLLEAGSETDELINCIFFSFFPYLVKKRFCKLLLDHGVKCEEVEDEYHYLYYYCPELARYIKVDYKLEKIRDSFCATQIQNWFLRKYYDPYHPYGKERLERVFNDLTNELKKE
jgi:hypothetical protein